MSETRTISIPVYRDAEGRPVCGYSNTAACWLMQKSVWPRHCLATGDKLYLDDDWQGHIIPTPNCPLWKDDAK